MNIFFDFVRSSAKGLYGKRNLFADNIQQDKYKNR